MEKEMCNDCKKKFQEQNGALKLLDMCEECRRKHLLLILEPEDKMIH